MALTHRQRQFLNRLDSFKREYDFSVQVAAAEEQALKDTAKHRVVSALQARRKALQKDREILDSSDINAMLHGAGIILTAPGSPGPHNNRKTRHGGRHTKQEQDNQETTESAKRKRRQDFDESPGPGSRNLIGTTSWTRDIPTPGDSDVAKYFSPKDLSLHYRQANTIVAESWVERKPIRTNGIPQLMNGHHENGRYNGVQESGDDEEIDTSALVAPAMDRTGSHATRSTRNNQTDITLARDTFEALKNPERMYGLAVIEALGPRQPKAAKADLEAPWTPSLTSAEIMEDRAYLDTL